MRAYNEAQRKEEEGRLKFGRRCTTYPKKNFFVAGCLFFVGARLTVAPLPLFRTGVAEEGGFFEKEEEGPFFCSGLILRGKMKMCRLNPLTP